MSKTMIMNNKSHMLSYRQTFVHSFIYPSLTTSFTRKNAVVVTQWNDSGVTFIIARCVKEKKERQI